MPNDKVLLMRELNYATSTDVHTDHFAVNQRLLEISPWRTSLNDLIWLRSVLRMNGSV